MLQVGELAAWLSEHSLGNRFGLAVIGTGPGYDAQAVALAIVAADGDGRYIDAGALTPDDQEALASWFADPGPPKAVHDAKPALHALRGRGWTLRGVTSDTVLAAYLLRSERQSCSLNDLLVRHMRCALPSEAVQGDTPHTPHTPKGLILQACAVLDLADVLDEELARIDSSSLLGRLELPAQRVLAETESVGIAVDRRLLGQGAGELVNAIAPDGRIHAALPAGVGPDERGAFVAGEDYAELMTAHYDQLETRILAHRNGERGVLDEAREAGYASTLLGRRRYLADLGSDDAWARQSAERAALAMAIDGSAADILKVAMIDVAQVIKAAGLRSRLVLQAADQLVFEVASGERDGLAAYVQESMCGAYPLDVPLEVSIGCGPTWGAAASASHIRE
ncbi:hypothetical protein A5636_24025 [Mycobacterium asiaticum]|uniref:DNA polymerase I n=1 Tax=Mycobacterium asiaticum TaxID=1790 RepID=A0A1A3N6C0_MYCAS|nr:hypothetical protein A5636_24025 [Mycobacterium asiaticum]